MTDSTAIAPGAYDSEPRVADYIALLKPRVMSLVVFTALVGLAAAPGSVHPVLAFAAILCIAVGAGASGALNMWWDADIDARMDRTKARPIPAGRITPGQALGFGLGLSLLSVAMLTVFANPVAGALLAFTIFYYAVIYTMWLKRSTPQNIVIGGAAGAFPPMVGWAAVTGGVALEPILMFAVIFLWTPPHFWALALWRRVDYSSVGVPMLPVVAGEPETRRQIGLYTVAMTISALALAFSGSGGPVYFAAAVALSVWFGRAALQVCRRTASEAAVDGYRAEKRLFGVSIAYLFALFGAILIESALGDYAGWWPQGVML